MPWNPIASLTPRETWVYTPVTTGEYFRFKFTSFVPGESFAAAQSQTTNPLVDLQDVIVQPIFPEAMILRFVQPLFFTERKIAVRRIAPLVSLESQLRKVLDTRVLKPSNGGEGLVRPVATAVAIEVFVP